MAEPDDVKAPETLDHCEKIAKRLCTEDGSTSRWPTVARLLAAALVDPEYRALAASATRETACTPSPCQGDPDDLPDRKDCLRDGEHVCGLVARETAAQKNPTEAEIAAFVKGANWREWYAHGSTLCAMEKHTAAEAALKELHRMKPPTEERRAARHPSSASGEHGEVTA